MKTPRLDARKELFTLRTKGLEAGREPSWRAKTRLNDDDIIELNRKFPEYQDPNFSKTLKQLQQNLLQLKLGDCKAADTLKGLIAALNLPLGESDHNSDIQAWINLNLYPKEKGAEATKVQPSKPMRQLRTVVNELLANRVADVKLDAQTRESLEAVRTMLNRLEEIMCERERSSRRSLHVAEIRSKPTAEPVTAG